MHRCFLILGIALTTTQLCSGCGSSKSPAPQIVVTPVSAAKPIGPTLVRDKTVAGSDGLEIPFTLELPPGWTWSDGQAEKTISTDLTIVVSVTARAVPDDEKSEPSTAAARRRLVELPDEKMLNDLATGGKVAIRDRRIIEVGNRNATWDVLVFQAEEDQEPIRLEAHCYLKLGDKEFTINGSHIDTRSDRTAADFDASQADFLKIGQSFRVESGPSSGK